MPTLEFKGKEVVYAHHLGVPFRPLIPASVFSGGKPKKLRAGAVLEDVNRLIHGDNLHALKALMPRYAGRVNCVCIDPPYNTGKEGWVYNDNVNSRLMKRWLRENSIVDHEDLERHDKWLCMMWPRLRLLRDLMAEDGVIFIFIDDNEQHRLRMMMDEIFGPNNFIANIVVRTNPGGRDYGGIARTHDYVLVYGKSKEASLGMIAVNEGELPLSDDNGGFELRELRNRNKRFHSKNRPNLYYPFYVNPKGADKDGLHEVSLTTKKGWIKTEPMKSAGVQTVWRWGKEKALEHINMDVKAKPKSGGGFHIVEKFRRIGTRERSIMDDKDYRNEQGTLTVKSLLGDSVNGNSANGDLSNGDSAVFDYPKSEVVVKRLLELGTHPDSIVLDSFAGSGTVAHAVLELNAQDKGDRKFILVECEDYAENITAERINRVIGGAPKARDKKLQKGFGGSFAYCEIGASTDEETLLANGLPSYEALAEYLAYTATGQRAGKVRKGANWFFGEAGGYRMHLIYEQNPDFLRSDASALTEELAAKIGEASKNKGKPPMIFAPCKFVTRDVLRSLAGSGAEFSQLPYALQRMGEEED